MTQYNQDFYPTDQYNTPDPQHNYYAQQGGDQQQGGDYQQQGGDYQQQGGDYQQQGGDYQQQGGYQQGWPDHTSHGYDMSSAGYIEQPVMYPQGYSGDVMEVNPGALGQMNTGARDSFGGDTSNGYGFEEEPPLLEELGIDLSLIKENTLSVLNPLKPADVAALSNTDLAGPLLFCLLFGGILLLTGKVHFGYIYGVGLLGCVSLYIVLNLMSIGGVSIGCVVSVLGYCLLPMVFLSAVSVILSLNGVIGMPLAVLFICWCSYSASKLFVSVLSMESQQLLVAYPCALVYGIFALLTVF